MIDTNALIDNAIVSPNGHERLCELRGLTAVCVINNWLSQHAEAMSWTVGGDVWALGWEDGRHHVEITLDGSDVDYAVLAETEVG